MQLTPELGYLGLSAFVSGVAFFLVASWYLWPRLSARSLPAALTPLLLFSAFRVNGLFFLVPGVASADMPLGFAVPTAYGDATAALLALAAAVALRYHPALGIVLTWVYSAIGSLDLVNAMARVALNGVTPAHLAATWMLPTINVPALIVTHVLIFVLLVRGRRPRTP